LEAAIADGDPIRAVIANTGMNSDGHTQGITRPSSDAQAELMRSVFRSAGIKPEDIGYMEAHGTGTKAGDPIEMEAVHNAISQYRSKKDPLLVGSVKTNFGHLENASGMVSLIKVICMLEKNFVLPNHGLKTPRNDIPFDEWNMKVRSSIHSKVYSFISR
jgi:acyl transferase domain-containing protein